MRRNDIRYSPDSRAKTFASILHTLERTGEDSSSRKRLLPDGLVLSKVNMTQPSEATTHTQVTTVTTPSTATKSPSPLSKCKVQKERSKPKPKTHRPLTRGINLFQHLNSLEPQPSLAKDQPPLIFKPNVVEEIIQQYASSAPGNKK